MAHKSQYLRREDFNLSRRQFITGVNSTLFGLAIGSVGRNAAANSYHRPDELAGRNFHLSIDYAAVNFTGNSSVATAINGSVPGPILRWREGDSVKIRVTNNLAEDTSIHWHGIILPTNMDGVPGLSYNGIKPGETFEYQFQVRQAGTYWYHSHSAFQEQTGHYGAIIIDPREKDPVGYDRDYVVQLSDWSDENPHHVFANLKKMSDYYNRNERTAADLIQEIKQSGIAETWRNRLMWNRMRMSDRDIADVTGYTYTFLMNGQPPAHGWTGQFKKGERVRLRFINSSAMTIFDIRIPGLRMTVVNSDGQNIEPVTVDEFRIGVAETYDVIVKPVDDMPYTLFAQSIDRSGYARGTLTPNPEWQAEIPALDPPPVLGHRDMGMPHGDHGDHSGHDMATMKTTAQDGMAPNMEPSRPVHHHGVVSGLAPAGMGSMAKISHAASEFGPQVDMRAAMPADGLHDPGVGLRSHLQLYGRTVLTYGDLRNLTGTIDRRDPGREIQLHLTGNMNRYMWSFDGIRFAEAEPLNLDYGERVRITLVNDTMMTHPIHLHGMWSELETGDPDYIPRKHTVLVQPGSKISYLVTADAYGRWAYHCHLMYHMMGMFREVRVS